VCVCVCVCVVCVCVCVNVSSSVLGSRMWYREPERGPLLRSDGINSQLSFLDSFVVSRLGEMLGDARATTP